MATSARLHNTQMCYACAEVVDVRRQKILDILENGI